MDNIGDLLRKKREKAKLSLRELSEKSKIDHSYIAKIERGEAKPTEALLLRICSTLKLSDKETEKVFALGLKDRFTLSYKKIFLENVMKIPKRKFDDIDKKIISEIMDMDRRKRLQVLDYVKFLKKGR